MTATYTVYKGSPSPFKVSVFDVDGTPYSTTKMAGITRALIYVNGTYIDSDSYSTAFDWVTNESRSEMIIDIGMFDISTGIDNYSEVRVYDADYTSGRVIKSISVNVDGSIYGGETLAKPINAAYGLIAEPATDWAHGDYSGIPVSVTVKDAATAIGIPFALDKSDRTYVKAKADSRGTMPACMISLATASTGATCLMLREGYIKSTSWSWSTAATASEEIYISDATAGELTSTALTSTSEIIYAQSPARIYNSSIIYWHGNPLIVEVAT